MLWNFFPDVISGSYKNRAEFFSDATLTKEQEVLGQNCSTSNTCHALLILIKETAKSNFVFFIFIFMGLVYMLPAFLIQ